MNRRIKKKHIPKFSMFVFHKFFPTRRMAVPVTTNDTRWTSCLRLKRVHHRQLEYLYAINKNCAIWGLNASGKPVCIIMPWRNEK